MEIKTSNIKKKKEASLAYAYDENNVYGSIPKFV